MLRACLPCLSLSSQLLKLLFLFSIRSSLPLQALEGNISAALVTPDLRHAGTFRASFLVVAALPHPSNHLGNLQRARWVPGGDTLDIG
jgi:hypothetical protein